MFSQVASVIQIDASVAGNSFACVSQSSTLGSWSWTYALMIIFLVINYFCLITISYAIALAN